MNIKDALEILDGIANAPRIDELKAIIYDLQKENLDLHTKLMDTEAKLKIHLDWSQKASLYKEYKTSYGAVVYRKIKEDIPGIFYCPACFDKNSIIPLQPVPAHMHTGFHLPDHLLHRYCPSCSKILTIEEKK